MDNRPLAQQDHATLYMQRERTRNKTDQNRIAPYEHRAFAREATAENPLMAVPIGLAAPLYQLSKSIPGLESRSDPSMDQLLHSWLGIVEGLQQNETISGILKMLK